jgi:hypothetical protein
LKIVYLLVFLSFGYCIVCPSVFWLLYCLSFCLLVIVLSVLLSFGYYIVSPSVFWSLYCLSFCFLVIILSVFLFFGYSIFCPFFCLLYCLSFCLLVIVLSVLLSCSLYCLSSCLLFIVLSVLLSFGHCIVCPSVFWSLCCLSFCLLVIVLSVLWFTASRYPIGIFKVFFRKHELLQNRRIILRIRTRYSNWYMGRHRMVVGFTTNYAISAYHHWCCEFESRSGRDVQHYAIKCQWLATGRWFSSGPTVSSTNKTDRHDITEIWLKVALNTIKQTNKHYFSDLLNNILR